MTSIVDAKIFSIALNKTMKFAERAPVTSLEEVKADFCDGNCTLSATNLEQWAFADIPAQGDDFSFLFRMTKEVAKMCKDLDGALRVEFTPDEKIPRVRLTCAGRRGDFVVYPAVDFPEPPAMEQPRAYTIDAGRILKRVERIKCAAGMRGDRPSTQAVRFFKDQMFCVDGYRMAVSQNAELTVEKPFFIPAQAFRHWGTFFPAGAAELAVDRRYARIAMEGLSLWSRLSELDELTPERAFPTSCREQFTVSPKAFEKELGYLSQFVKAPMQEPIRFSGGALSVKTPRGEFAAQIALNGTSETEFGFHIRYMLEAMHSLNDYGQITIETSSQFAPIVLRADEENYALILPMRLKETQAAA